MNGISLFSGIGGIELGLHEEVKTVAYVEREPYAQAVLISRMSEGSLRSAPIYDDVRTFPGEKYRGVVDIIFGGFPCQDISVAGKGAGIKEGTRSGLFFELMRVVGEVRPEFVFLENVSAITNRGLDVVLGELSEAGYNARWTTSRASDVGAMHKRERWFCLAYTRDNSDIPKRRKIREENSISEVDRKEICSRLFAGAVNDTNNGGKRIQRICQEEIPRLPTFSWCKDVRRIEDLFGRSDIPEPIIRGKGHGIPHPMDRVKCLGNAVVPQQCRKAWEILTGER